MDSTAQVILCTVNEMKTLLWRDSNSYVICTYTCIKGVRKLRHIQKLCSPAYQSFSLPPSNSQTFGALICTEVLDGVTLVVIVATVLDLKGADIQVYAMYT